MVPSGSEPDFGIDQGARKEKTRTSPPPLQAFTLIQTHGMRKLVEGSKELHASVFKQVDWSSVVEVSRKLRIIE